MFSKRKPALEVRHLSKVYQVVSSGSHSWWRSKREAFWALRDVSLQIGAGEVVGVIGRNGAGKSTLLKILTRITSPTSGEADLFGRVGSLLEVGTGFHPELTGRENIFLNGSILGMRRAEIASQFDHIVAFAGVERFLETPVKRYSSGMYVRLAFAVAAHLRSEILLVDEVLSVGDLEFQKRCLGKMKDAADGGRTVLFVSHHLESVAALCSRAIVLNAGRISYDGPVAGAIGAYMGCFGNNTRSADPLERRAGSGEVRIVEALPGKACFESAETKTFRLKLRRMRPVHGPFFVSIHLLDSFGSVVAQCDSRLQGQWFVIQDAMDLGFAIKTPWLKPGVYALDVFLCAAGILDRCEHACSFEVLPFLPYEGVASPEATAHGLVFADFEFRGDFAGAPCIGKEEVSGGMQNTGGGRANAQA